MLTFVIGLFLAIVGPIAAISGNLFHQATGLPVAAGRVGGAFACLIWCCTHGYVDGNLCRETTRAALLI